MKFTPGLTLGGVWTSKSLNALSCVFGGKVVNVQMKRCENSNLKKNIFANQNGVA